ncbi:hypothetical protein [Dyadobacter luticola]|uniref:DUF3806 domain-containing protein n=1 Tax=Dyadobacter luticola TaxID=1979387 RepID=A0A5R9KUY3_9BACT|nr:hypothetical protein [Dyadobacter luticola]TLV00041.1 hypothetical protein FEN17_11035 [Dyadobacter luticola]
MLIHNKVSRDHFECWLIEMDDALDSFIASFPESIRQGLNFSVESLDSLEEWLLNRYDNLSETKVKEEAMIIDGLARYVGETFRKALGGKWTIELDNPVYAYYRIPTLAGLGGRNLVACPAALVTTAVDRRRGDFWRTVLTNYKNRLDIISGRSAQQNI